MVASFVRFRGGGACYVFGESIEIDHPRVV